MKLLVVIFFKQKTAYEMRISDWSSAVCSSASPLALKSRMDEGIEILPIFRLRWLENRGVSMGFFHAETDVMRWLLVGMTMVIAAFVGVWMWREKARQDVAALGLVLGGAIGNIIDRVRLGYVRSEEHTSELQSLMRISYAVFCLKKKDKSITNTAKSDHVIAKP